MAVITVLFRAVVLFGDSLRVTNKHFLSMSPYGSSLLHYHHILCGFAYTLSGLSSYIPNTWRVTFLQHLCICFYLSHVYDLMTKFLLGVPQVMEEEVIYVANIIIPSILLHCYQTSMGTIIWFLWKPVMRLQVSASNCQAKQWPRPAFINCFHACNNPSFVSGLHKSSKMIRMKLTDLYLRLLLPREITGERWHIIRKPVK